MQIQVRRTATRQLQLQLQARARSGNASYVCPQGQSCRPSHPPERRAASVFSLTPPMGSTLPVSVTSPGGQKGWEKGGMVRARVADPGLKAGRADEQVAGGLTSPTT